MGFTSQYYFYLLLFTFTFLILCIDLSSASSACITLGYEFRSESGQDRKLFPNHITLCSSSNSNRTLIPGAGDIPKDTKLLDERIFSATLQVRIHMIFKIYLAESILLACH